MFIKCNICVFHIRSSERDENLVVTKQMNIQKHELEGVTNSTLDRLKADLERIKSTRGRNRAILFNGIRSNIKEHFTFLINRVVHLESQLLQSNDNEMALLKQELEKLKQENATLVTWRERYRKHIEAQQVEIDTLKENLVQAHETTVHND